jgi:DNA mismatch repair protein MutS
LQATAAALAALDALGALGFVARQNGYRRPVVTADRSLAITNGRHPVVEQVLSAGQFVPNSCHFDAAQDNLHVITGPNMAGKSTFMRQAALITILAQMGSYVPAERAEIGLVDRIFTRIGALDNLSAGQSTFMVEMAETADILNNATERSLVILDEIGRGTSTYDGLALAWAVAEYLNERQVRTFFATHYHELADLARRHAGIKNYHMAVEENGHEVIFLRELRRGATGKSYGIHVAKLAGIPASVVANARLVLESIGRKGKGVPKAVAETAVQASLFAAPEPEPDEIRAAVMALELEQLRPIEALNFLYDLRRRLADG